MLIGIQQDGSTVYEQRTSHSLSGKTHRTHRSNTEKYLREQLLYVFEWGLLCELLFLSYFLILVAVQRAQNSDRSATYVFSHS